MKKMYYLLNVLFIIYSIECIIYSSHLVSTAQVFVITDLPQSKLS